MSIRRFLIVLTVAVLATFSALAEDPEIIELSATEKDQKISVSFELSGAFDLEELNKALESGLPTGFTYHVELFRKRHNWFDTTQVEATLELVCTYDSRTREYLLNYRREGRLVRSETFSDLAKLRKRMVNVTETDLFETGGVPTRKLRVRVRADLMRGYLFYVIPWDISTKWTNTAVTSEKPASE